MQIQCSLTSPRAYDLSLALSGGEHDDRERRRCDDERMLVAAAPMLLGVHAAAVADAAAAVDLGVGVEDLAPEAWARHPYAVAIACNRREVHDDDDRRI